MIEKVEISLLSALVGHGYVRQGGGEWPGSHRVWYHLYVTLENRDPPDATASAQKDSIQVGSRADARSAKKVGRNIGVDAQAE